MFDMRSDFTGFWIPGGTAAGTVDNACIPSYQVVTNNTLFDATKVAVGPSGLGFQALLLRPIIYLLCA